jgi:phage gpG-like protein
MSVPKMALTLDLEDLMGTQVPDDEDIRQEIAQAVIDKIIDRTQSGKSLNGKPFKKLSEEYADRKMALVGSSEADLHLYGDMFESMTLTDSTAEEIVIGFDDETQNAKAYNHDTGDTLPRRQFFGITEKEKREIRAEFGKLAQGPPSKQEKLIRRLSEILAELEDE